MSYTIGETLQLVPAVVVFLLLLMFLPQLVHSLLFRKKRRRTSSNDSEILLRCKNHHCDCEDCTFSEKRPEDPDTPSSS